MAGLVKHVRFDENPTIITIPNRDNLSEDSRCKSMIKKIEDFIHGSTINVPYGFQEHILYGIGSNMLVPFSILINRLKEVKTEHQNTLIYTMNKIGMIVALIFSIPFILLSGLIKGIGAAMPVKIDPLTNECIPKTSPERIDQLYDLADIFHRIAEKHQVKYFVEAGTLLGALRDDPKQKIEPGIIRHDDDIDAGAMISEKEKIEGMSDDLRKEGVILKHTEGQPLNFHLSFDPEVLARNYGVKAEAGHMDLFLYEEFGEKVSYADPTIRNNFTQYYFNKEDMNDLVQYPFGPPRADGTKIMLWGVNKKSALESMKRAYGEDCLWFGVKTHSHAHFFGMTLPIPGLQRTKFKITTSCAEGLKWKKVSPQ